MKNSSVSDLMATTEMGITHGTPRGANRGSGAKLRVAEFKSFGDSNRGQERI